MSPQRPVEKITLHFDLTHCPANLEFTLLSLGNRYRLTAHTPETLREYRKKNKMLTLIPESAFSSITHFVDNIEVPADAVSFHWVSYLASDPKRFLEEIATVFRHVPAHVRRRAIRKKQRSGQAIGVPAVLKRYGVKSVPQNDAEEILIADGLFKSAHDAAVAIIFSHPDVASLNPMVAENVMHNHIEQALEVHPDLVTYIKQNPRTWYSEVVAPSTQYPGTQPLSGLIDKNGNTVNWPTQDGVNVAPQYDLSTDITGTSSQPGVALPVLQRVLQTINNDMTLKGQKWTKQPGVTCRRKTQVSPAPSARGGKLAQRLGNDAPVYKWATSLDTPQYGLDHDSNSFSFTNDTVSFTLKNWANRGLGVYIQFFDDAGVAIDNPSNWQDQFESGTILQRMFESSYSKKYLQMLGAGNVVFGIPAWTEYTTLSFPFPPEAVRAQVLLGGLGIGNSDDEVDGAGTVYTCVLGYGVPSLLSVLSVGLVGSKWYIDFFNDSAAFRTLLAVGGPALLTGAVVEDPSTTLSMAANTVAQLIFSAAMTQFAKVLTLNVTEQQILQNCPFAGLVLKMASMAGSAAAMIATTVEVCESPATYSIDIKRAMDVSVTVSPDPTHGIGSQLPIWPDVSTTWECTLMYKDGTFYAQTGPMPAEHDQPINVLFDTVPSSPSDSVQVQFNVFSKTNWLAGKWASAWAPAVPTDQTTLPFTGSIIEALVPLTATTQYSHYQKLIFNTDTQQHEWQSGAAPGATRASLDCSNTGNNLCQLIGITLNDNAYAAGYTWKASGQNLPIDDGNSPVESQMYAFQGISVLAHPQAAIKNPALGFSNQPYLVFDQFGPQPLFSVSDAYGDELDQQTIPNDLSTLFAAQSRSYSLPAGAAIQVQTAGSEWIVADASGASIYDLTLVASGQASIINVRSAGANAFLFSLPSAFQPTLDSATISEDLTTAFARASVSYDIPPGATVTVKTATAEWFIGLPNQQPIFDLRRSVDIIQVFPYPAPPFSKRNFYLDTRQSSDNKYYLRQVALDDATTSFDYTAGQSWGAFTPATISAMAVHPNGFVIAVDDINHKMQVLTLPDAAVADAQAPLALPMSGKGECEGLLQGPVGMTVTPDGRILILERDNLRIQAFDTVANPVQCFAGSLQFTLDSSFQNDLDSNTISAGFSQAYQKSVPLPASLTPVVTLGLDAASDLDACNVTAEVIQAFGNAGVSLSSDTQVTPTVKGSLWLLNDATNSLNFDIRKDDAASDLAVYHAASLSVTTRARGSEWLLSDRSNNLTFDVKVDPKSSRLDVQQLVSTMPLHDPASANVTYLDIAVESKSYIYVLSYVNDGSQLTDYRLDIYNPDGTFLSRTPDGSGDGVNGAKIVVDQWRNLYTLNYERLSGPANRTEPSVSTWIPSTPPGNSN